MPGSLAKVTLKGDIPGSETVVLRLAGAIIAALVCGNNVMHSFFPRDSVPELARPRRDCRA